MTTTTDVEGRTIGGRELASRGAIAIALSLLVNWVVLWVVLTGDLVEPFDALSYPPVTLLTALGALGATVAYWVILRFSERPDRTFVIVAAVVLLLSFVPDVALLRFDPAATLPAIVVLMALHVTVAVISVAALTDAIPVDPNRLVP